LDFAALAVDWGSILYFGKLAFQGVGHRILKARRGSI